MDFGIFVLTSSLLFNGYQSPRMKLIVHLHPAPRPKCGELTSMPPVYFQCGAWSEWYICPSYLLLLQLLDSINSLMNQPALKAILPHFAAVNVNHNISYFRLINMPCGSICWNSADVSQCSKQYNHHIYNMPRQHDHS